MFCFVCLFVCLSVCWFDCLFVCEEKVFGCFVVCEGRLLLVDVCLFFVCEVKGACLFGFFVKVALLFVCEYCLFFVLFLK